jgi:hypothetical protein
MSQGKREIRRISPILGEHSAKNYLEIKAVGEKNMNLK